MVKGPKAKTFHKSSKGTNSTRSDKKNATEYNTDSNDNNENQGDKIPPLVPKGAEWHVALALGVFVSIYVKCTAASLPSGDAGDFIIAARHFGVAHPPGYPLYVTMGYIWMKVLPFGNPAYRLNLLTSIFGGLAAGVIYLTTFKITNYIPSAVIASGLFAFSRLIWFHSIGAEIFSLNNLFCGILLLWVVKFQQTPVSLRAKVAIEASFISGLSMCNQHTSGLFIGTIGLWMFLSLLKDKAITVKQFVNTGLAFAGALIPYIQLPISATFFKVPSTWGDQRNLAGFWKHITRLEYGTFRLTASDRPSDIVGNFQFYTEDLVSELGLTSLLLSCLAIVTSFRIPKIRTVVYVILATLSGYVLFFCNQANIDTKKQLMRGVLERFWMQSNVAIAILSGCGLWVVYHYVSQAINVLEKPLKAASLIFALVLTYNQIALNYSTCDLSSNYIMYKYGKSLLDSLPRNAILMVEGDMPSLTSRYLRYVEGYREDVDVVDQELIGFNWHKPMHAHSFKHYQYPYDGELYYRELLGRKGEKRPFSYTFNEVFDVHLQNNVPLYVYPYMKEGDHRWKDNFDLWPVNMLYSVRRKTNPYSLEEFLKIISEADYFVEEIHNCDSSLYPTRSWEYVIAEACGHTAFFPVEHAHRLIVAKEDYTDPGSIQQLYKIIGLYDQSYLELTRRLPDGSLKHFFQFQHNKNYATLAYVLYTNLIRTDKVEALKFARLMCVQFQFYFERLTEPEADNDKQIRSLVASVKQSHPTLMTDPKYERRDIPAVRDLEA